MKYVGQTDLQNRNRNFVCKFRNTSECQLVYRHVQDPEWEKVTISQEKYKLTSSSDNPKIEMGQIDPQHNLLQGLFFNSLYFIR